MSDGREILNKIFVGQEVQARLHNHVPTFCKICNEVVPPALDCKFHESRQQGFYFHNCLQCNSVTFYIDGRYPHEISLSSCLNSFLDRAFNESVLHAASAVESAYSHFVLLHWLLHGGSADSYSMQERGWTQRSERLRGAFEYIRHLPIWRTYLDFPIPPNFDKLAEFRNKVIHRFHLATDVEALNYCGPIFEWILALHEYSANIDRIQGLKLLSGYVDTRRKDAAKFAGISVQCFRIDGLGFSRFGGFHPKMSFVEALQRMRDFETAHRDHTCELDIIRYEYTKLSNKEFSSNSTARMIFEEPPITLYRNDL